MQINCIALCSRTTAAITPWAISPAGSKTSRHRTLCSTKMLLAMKLTILFTLLLLNVSATSLSQTVSFSGKSVSLKSVFAAIQKQTGYVVFYDNQLLKSSRPVTLSVEDAPLEVLLKAALKDQGMTFTILDRTIAIRKQELLTLPPILKLLVPGWTVTGRVTDESNTPLPGVTVLQKGTSNATVTNEAGEFRLANVNDGAVIVFSYIGFNKEEVTVNRQYNLNIRLSKAANTALDELVVVGYGTMKKSDLTGAVSTVKGDALAARKTTQVSQALQGAVPGVMVTRTNNAPGATAQIRVRGITTITDAGATPLIILDGVPVDDINSINPNDIDNISVLKDAASASIYGSRAAAGVILVTTKRAKNGQLDLNYTYEYGAEKPTKLPDYANAVRYMQLTNELRWNDNGNNANEYPTYTKDIVDNYASLHAENPDQYPNTDWRGLILNNSAPRESHALSISGAGKALRSRVSLVYDKVGALYDDRSYDRLTTRINNDITINKYLTASVDVNYKRTIVKQPTIDPMYKMGIMPPIYAAMWSDGRIGAGKDGANIYVQTKYGGFDNDWFNQLGGKVGLDFTPIEGLKISGVVAPFLNFDKGKRFTRKVPYLSLIHI